MVAGGTLRVNAKTSHPQRKRVKKKETRAKDVNLPSSSRAWFEFFLWSVFKRF
jgi:hypothetical protein